MSPRIAAIISTVGSPVFLFPVVISFLAISKMGMDCARPLVITVFAIFFLLCMFILLRKWRGKITNLDVSDRTQRSRNVYLPSLGMLFLAALYFKISGLPFFNEAVFFGLLLSTCYAINSQKKISLHTVIATYLSALVLEINPWVGLGFFIFATLIAWSRVVLGRHTKEEVVLGWIVGTVFGLLHVVLF